MLACCCKCGCQFRGACHTSLLAQQAHRSALGLCRGGRLQLSVVRRGAPAEPSPCPPPVQRHDLHDELAAEQAHGTKAVVVNFEETHFRFRSFHSVSEPVIAVLCCAG